MFFVVAVAYAVSYLAFDRYAERMARGLETRYLELGIPAFLDDYPGRESPNIRQIESLGEALGLSFSLKTGIHPRQQSPATGYLPLENEVRDYWRAVAVSSVATMPPIPPRAERFLLENEATIESLIEAILEDQPEWNFDNEQILQGQGFSPFTYLKVQNLLILEAIRRHGLGRQNESWRAFRAYWDLMNALNAYPGYLVPMVGLSTGRRAIPFLLRVENIPPNWEEEFEHFRARPVIQRALVVDLYTTYRIFRFKNLEGPARGTLWQNLKETLLEPLNMAGAYRYQEIFLDAYGEIESWDWEDIESGELHRDIRGRIPPWYFADQWILAKTEKRWLEAYHLDLSFELLRHVQSLKKSGDQEQLVLDSFPRPALREGYRWVAGLVGPEIEVRIEPAIVDPNKAPLPFSYRWPRSR